MDFYCHSSLLATVQMHLKQRQKLQFILHHLFFVHVKAWKVFLKLCCILHQNHSHREEYLTSYLTPCCPSVRPSLICCCIYLDICVSIQKTSLSPNLPLQTGHKYSQSTSWSTRWHCNYNTEIWSGISVIRSKQVRKVKICKQSYEGLSEQGLYLH